MTTSIEFANICRQAGHLLDLREPEALAEGEVFSVEGIDMQIAFEEEEGGVVERVQLLVKLGSLEDEDKLQVYKAMLALNLELDPSDQGALCLDPETGHAMLSAPVTLYAVGDEDRLAAHIQDCAAFALRFREQSAHTRSRALPGFALDSSFLSV